MKPARGPSYVLGVLGVLALAAPTASIGAESRSETVKTKVRPGQTKSFRMHNVDTALAFRNTQAAIGYRKAGRDRHPDWLPDLSNKKYVARYRKAGARIVARARSRTGVLRIKFVNRGRDAQDFRLTYHRGERVDGDAAPSPH